MNDTTGVCCSVIACKYRAAHSKVHQHPDDRLCAKHQQVASKHLHASMVATVTHVAAARLLLLLLLPLKT
jgi:hypothetical protein